MSRRMSRRQAGGRLARLGAGTLVAGAAGPAVGPWEVLPGQGQYYNPDFDTPAGRRRHQGHATDITTELALDWLDQKRDPGRPFLLMCQHKAPHRNWMPAPDKLDLFGSSGFSVGSS